MILERKLSDYNGPVITSLSKEINETRISLHQDGRWVSFSSEALDRIVEARDDFNTLANRDTRLAVARGTI